MACCVRYMEKTVMNNKYACRLGNCKVLDLNLLIQLKNFQWMFNWVCETVCYHKKYPWYKDKHKPSAPTIYYIYLHINVSLVCGILKMVGPKIQKFCPRINMLKENCFKTFLQWIMVCQKVPKSYFQSQFSTSKIDGICQNILEKN